MEPNETLEIEWECARLWDGIDLDSAEWVDVVLRVGGKAHYAVGWLGTPKLFGVGGLLPNGDLTKLSRALGGTWVGASGTLRASLRQLEDGDESLVEAIDRRSWEEREGTSDSLPLVNSSLAQEPFSADRFSWPGLRLDPRLAAFATASQAQGYEVRAGFASRAIPFGYGYGASPGVYDRVVVSLTRPDAPRRWLGWRWSNGWEGQWVTFRGGKFSHEFVNGELRANPAYQSDDPIRYGDARDWGGENREAREAREAAVRADLEAQLAEIAARPAPPRDPKPWEAY